MEIPFLRDAINVTLTLYDRHGLSFEGSADELRKLQDFKLDNQNAAFGARWRLANAAFFLSRRVPEPLRAALLSVAYFGYNFCASHEPRFKPSLEDVQGQLPRGGALPVEQILEIFASHLSDAASTGSDTAATSWPTIVETPDAAVAGNDSSSAETAVRPRITFSPPPATTLRQRLEALLNHYPAVPVGEDRGPQEDALAAFRSSLSEVMEVGDAGRTFTDFAPLDRDLASLEPQFLRLVQTDNPKLLQDRARQSRRLAESIEFGLASPDDYRCARSAWLVSAFWNSQLARYWPASRPNVVYDFLGYLTTIQADLRYSDAEFLLLLRVSFSVCRIASHDGLMPLQFASTAAERLPSWIQHTVGTVLATAGPGRVPPSRVAFDTRLAGLDRNEYAERLLRQWRTEAERAAAATLLLEMGAWDPVRSSRILSHLLTPQGGEYEVWQDILETMAHRSKRVRVVRPNPWSPGADKLITVEREAVAMLAADVVDRHYQVLGGDISLRGHDFRERRVPTFVCSAEFGPLGLFKLDASDRIVREVENFARYAQRLHPRYRASRCDHSMAVITEPDDDRQFVQGALTSYVFTEDETPRTLNAWFLGATAARSKSLCVELFEKALRPWYGHAAPATIDVFAEFGMFSHSALARLQRDCQLHHSIDLNPHSAPAALSGAAHWIASLLNYLEGDGEANSDIAYMASELQVLRTYRSVCHGDLHLDNVLVVGKQGAEYPCVIDFEATHEGYVLKDFGRFAAATICRTFDWNERERASLVDLAPRLLLDWRQEPHLDGVTESVEKVCGAILAARAGFLRAWQAGSFPTTPELVAAMVASLLPYARYPDTRRNGALLCLELSTLLVGSLSRGP